MTSSSRSQAIDGLDGSDVVDVRPITSFVGAEIRGVTLTSAMKPGVVARLASALDEWGVLLFADQALVGADLLAVARLLGSACDASSELIESSPYGSSPAWRVTSSFTADPPSVAVANFPQGRRGQTLWSDRVAAYEHLSPAFRGAVQGLHAIHESDGVRSEHPVVGVHRRTGRRSIDVNPTFTREIIGVHQRESDAILGILHSQLSQAAFGVRCRWQPGTVAIWDNCATAHLSTSDTRTAPSRATR